ncbi:hypothetical protein PQI66_14470 [Corynebacterium sp. USCH3]|uniref:hypothetical protein n=1 Tax=Corynebacterium sp. USCH3 TaxID=3024840 RepID=UPI0030AB7D42
MKISVKGIVGIVAFVVISSQVLAIQYGVTGALCGVAIGLVLGGVFAYIESPHNDWRPLNPLWVIVPLVGGVALMAPAFGAPLPLGAFACLTAWYASPRMWWRQFWLAISVGWLVFMAGFIILALMVAW